PPGAASSTVSTLAGSAGAPGFTDGTGAAARFRQLAGLAAAPNDVVYVADAGNHAIRRVDASGAVTTIAGNGSPGIVDAQGSLASFNNPQGVAVDPASGVIYVADTGNHSIRKIDSSGNVTTYAGDGGAGFVNGTGENARFNSPRGVAVDNLGRDFVADTGNQAARSLQLAATARPDRPIRRTPDSTDLPASRWTARRFMSISPTRATIASAGWTASIPRSRWPDSIGDSKTAQPRNRASPIRRAW